MTSDGPFPNLPMELQRKIWHYALPGPRIIQVHRYDSPYGRGGAFRFNGACPPAALHTCRTSREVACSVFETAFTHDNTSINKPLPPIYIDFAHDTVHFTTPCDPWTALFEALAWSFPDTQKIQSLAVEVSSPGAIEMALVHIMLPYIEIEGDFGETVRKTETSLREIVVIVRHQSDLLQEAKNPENVRFSEPEAGPWLPWQTWKDMEACFTEKLSDFWEGGVVRFKEVKIVL